MNFVKICIKYQNQVIKIHQFYHVIVLYLHKIRKLRIQNDLLKLMDLSIFTSVIQRLLAMVSSDEGLFFYILLYCIFCGNYLYCFYGGEGGGGFSLGLLCLGGRLCAVGIDSRVRRKRSLVILRKLRKIEQSNHDSSYFC